MRAAQAGGMAVAVAFIHVTNRTKSAGHEVLRSAEPSRN
jgi:hypothetical protein